MKNNMRLFISAAICVAMAAPLAGCGEQEANNAEVTKAEVNFSYPIETEETLTYWVRLPSTLSTSVKNYSETPFAQELEKQTGVKIEYQHPAQGQESEALNLLIASGDMPDIIETNWIGQPGGAASAIANSTIIPLNEYLVDTGSALKKYLDENPEIDKMVKTDDGKYFAFPFIRGDESLLASQGLMIRKDWLDELGLDVPTTIDEWEYMLRQFKEKKGSEAPLSLQNGQLMAFMGAFGITTDYLVEDGIVKYSPMQPGYLDFLKTIKSWYDEGLIDRDIAVMDKKMYDANILSGRSGATQGAGGSGMGYWLNAMKDQNPSFDLVAAPYPTLVKGERAKLGYKELPFAPQGSAAITTSCKNPVLAVEFLDYAYTEQGHMLNNFGIEGVSYNMVDGYPVYTDLILNNPDKLSVSQAMPLYMRSSIEAPIVQDKRYIEQYYALQQQKDAIKIWGDTDYNDYVLPRVSYTEEESAELASLTTEVSTFVAENQLKFILGEEDLANFDQFQEQIKTLGVERMLEIVQAAVDRYNAR